MGAHIAGGLTKFMGHQNAQGAVTVVGDADAIGDAVEAIAVVALFTGVDDFAEHGAAFCSDQERLGWQSRFWNDLLIGICLGSSHDTELADFHLAGGSGDSFVDLIGDQEVAEFGGVVTADASEEGGDINDA